MGPRKGTAPWWRPVGESLIQMSNNRIPETDSPLRGAH
jgi:hypothetical protein